MTLPPKQVRYVLARDQHTCTRCNQAAVAVVMRYTTDELRALHRDPANPDNWRASCVEHLDAA